MQISCKSDIGRMRSQNQDSVFASDKPVGKLPKSSDCCRRYGAVIKQEILRPAMQ